MWQKIKAGSYASEDGWNIWRVGSRWSIRTPRGAYLTASTFSQARTLVEQERQK